MGNRFTVTDITESGYKKLVDSEGEKDPLYQDPQGSWAKQQAYAGSKGQEGTVQVKERDTGRVVDNVPESDARRVTAHADDLSDGSTLTIPIDSTDDGRTFLQETESRWEAFQIHGVWRFDCKDSSGGPFITDGWSRVKGAVEEKTVKQPIVAPTKDGEGQEVVGWEEVHADTVSEAYQEASDSAWAMADCSVIRWENLRLELKLYVQEGSKFDKQAEQYTHIITDET